MTAPLLFTIGTVNAVDPSIFDGTKTALSPRSSGTPALTLIVLVFVLTAVARGGRPPRHRPLSQRGTAPVQSAS